MRNSNGSAARALMVAGLALLGAAACSTPEPRGIAFENVTVVDAAHGARPDQRVLVVDDRIVSVAPMAAAAGADEAPPAQVVDGRGRFLVPGLWDMHVHFLYDEALTEYMAGLFLEYGITSVRDTGGDMARLAALRARLQEGAEPAPRIFVSGPLLDGRFVVYDGADPGRPPLGTDVATPASAAARVAALDEAGADFIKIYELVMPNVFQALADEARARNLPIAAHVPLMMTADEAGPRVDSMEHLRNVELACAGSWAELLAARQQRITAFEEGRGYDLRRSLHADQRVPAIEAYDESRCATVLAALGDTVQVPTLRLNTLGSTRPFEREGWDDALAGLPEPVAGRWREEAAAIRDGDTDPTFADWSLFLVGLMHEHGVPIGAGTDTPIGLAVPGYSLHTELELLVRSGLTPREALHAATVMPASFFAMEDELGTVSEGKLADLVLLEADPLEDIANTRRIAGVMAAGRWLPRD